MINKGKHGKARPGALSSKECHKRKRDRAAGKLPPLQLYDGAEEAAEAAGLP